MSYGGRMNLGFRIKFMALGERRRRKVGGDTLKSPKKGAKRIDNRRRTVEECNGHIG